MDDATPLTETTEAKHRNLRPWVRGQSGNPAGRPRGSRHKLAEDFLRDLAEDWSQNGAEAIRELRKADVATYVRVVAATLPRELDVSVSQFHDVTSIVEAHRVALAIVRGDTETLQRHAPMIEHDDR